MAFRSRLTKPTARIFQALTRNQDGHHVRYQRFGELGDAFMPISAECIDYSAHGRIYAIHHYYEQMGDICFDPEVTFFEANDGSVYPLTYEVSGFAYRETAYVKDGAPVVQDTHWHNDLVDFISFWFQNVQNQRDVLNAAPQERELQETP